MIDVESEGFDAFNSSIEQALKLSSASFKRTSASQCEKAEA